MHPWKNTQYTNKNKEMSIIRQNNKILVKHTVYDKKSHKQDILSKSTFLCVYHYFFRLVNLQNRYAIINIFDDISSWLS